MNQDGLNQDLRLGRMFWVVACLVTPVMLFIFKPWLWELPLFSRAAGIVGIPLIASIAVYVIVLFVYELLFGRKTSRADVGAFACVMVYAIVGAALITYWKPLSLHRSAWVVLLTASTITLFQVLTVPDRKRD